MTTGPWRRVPSRVVSRASFARSRRRSPRRRQDPRSLREVADPSPRGVGKGRRSPWISCRVSTCGICGDPSSSGGHPVPGTTCLATCAWHRMLTTPSLAPDGQHEVPDTRWSTDRPWHRMVSPWVGGAGGSPRGHARPGCGPSRVPVRVRTCGGTPAIGLASCGRSPRVANSPPLVRRGRA